MRPNRALLASFVPVVSFVALVSLASVAALAACSGTSSTTGSSSGTTDPGSSGSSSGNTTSGGGTSASSASSSGASGTGGTSGTSGASGTSGSSGADPVAACIAACEAKYPKGALIGKGIDQCWSQSCPVPCNGIGAGTEKPPAHGSCQNPVSTPSADCSQCTVDKCCAAWDACFNDTECASLNTCSIACYK